MKKFSSLSVLTTFLAVGGALIFGISSGVPAHAQAVSQLVNGIVLSNNTDQNALSIMQNTTVGKGRSDSGALLINNTGNEHSGLTLYSNMGSAVSQPLVRLEVDNEGWDEEVLYIHSDSPTSRGLIRLDSPAPEIEYVETDQTGARGKFETRVQNDTFQINSRRLDDSTFENKMCLTHAGDLELVSGAVKALGNKPSEFKGGINITGGCLAVNGTCVTPGSLGAGSLAKNSESAPSSSGGTAKIMPVTQGKPSVLSCNSYDEQGTFTLDVQNNKLFVCNGPERGWDSVTLND